MNCYRTELVLFVFCSNSRMDWLTGTQFKLLMYLTMKADLKLLVRSRFMQFWDCRKKMRVRKKEWKVVEQVVVSRMSVMIMLLPFLYSNNYRGEAIV
jgi:hypothetical protein